MPRGKITDRKKSPTCWEYYQELDPKLSQKECEEKASYHRKVVNKRCIEFYQKNYPDLSFEEQEKLRIEFLHKVYENHPCHIEFYQKNYPNLSFEEQQRLLTEHMYTCNDQNIKYYQKKYPNLSQSELENLLENARKMHRERRPRLIGEKNPAHHSKTTELERKQRSPKCIEFYELRYPEKTNDERQQMLSDHLKLNTSKLTPEKHSTKIEYWLAKGFSKEEAKQKLRERQQTFSLKKCIQKYGEEEGLKRFEERQHKWQKSLHDHFNIDKIPQSNLATSIGKKLQKQFHNIQKEYQIGKYSYDYKYYNILIEINGDFWHCNPYIYDEDFYNKVSKKTAKEIWAKDADKKMVAENNGYKVYTIWEMDYNTNPQMSINKCLKFIKENVIY